jgi:hypothetical protein
MAGRRLDAANDADIENVSTLFDRRPPGGADEVIE